MNSRMSKKVSTFLAAFGCVVVVFVVLAMFVPAFDATKREEARYQAEYTNDVEMAEIDLHGRDGVYYTVKPGEGYQAAYSKSGLDREKLGIIDQDRDDIVRADPRNAKIAFRFNNPWPGDVIFAPYGKGHIDGMAKK